MKSYAYISESLGLRGAHLVGEHLVHLLEARVHAHQVVQVLRVAVEQIRELDQQVQLLRLCTRLRLRLRLHLRLHLRLPGVAQMPTMRKRVVLLRVVFE